MERVEPSQWRAEVCRNVSRIFRREREARGLSLNAMGKKAGLSYQMISYVESGERMPTIDTLLRMAIALEVNLWEVLREAEVVDGSEAEQVTQ